jgi:hypothetical protein
MALLILDYTRMYGLKPLRPRIHTLLVLSSFNPRALLIVKNSSNSNRLFYKFVTITVDFVYFSNKNTQDKTKSFLYLFL